MSTTLDPTFTFPTETNGSSNSGGLGSRGATYFFGFLITFVVLLLIFIGCGIGSRRRFMARRNAMLVGGAYQPWGPLSKDGSRFQTQPELYERLVADPVVEDQWRHMMPLSATYRRGPPKANEQEVLQGMYDHELYPPDHRDDVEDTHHPHEQSRTLGQHLRAWIPGLSNPREEEEIEAPPEDEKVELPPPEYLDIAVMIAMPVHPNARPSSSYCGFEDNYGGDLGGPPSSRDHPPAQLHIGTVSLPLDWPAELIVFPSPQTPVPPSDLR